MPSPSLSPRHSRTRPTDQTGPISEPETHDPRNEPNPGTHPLILAGSSALLLWASFPPASWSGLAWVALVPLFLLIQSERRARTVYFSAWAGGYLFWVLAIQWVRLSDEGAWPGWLLMAFALSLEWLGTFATARWAVKRLNWPLMVSAPLVWVGWEYIRAYLLTGFPWYYLAHTQYQNHYLTQISDFAGSLGLSLVVTLVNATIADLIVSRPYVVSPEGIRVVPRQAKKVAVLAGILFAVAGYGVFRVHTADFKPGPRIALIQTNFIQSYMAGRSVEETLNAFVIESQKIQKAETKPDLIVWPETSYPWGFVRIDPKLDDKSLDALVKLRTPDESAADWRDRAKYITAQLRAFADNMGIATVFGTGYDDFTPSGRSRYNSAIMFEPGVEAPQLYFKLHLVPFGEYVPLIQTFPWLTALTPYRGTHVPSLAFGPGPKWFQLKNYRLATAICFEDTVPQVTRRLFAEVPDGKQPDVLLNMSNDGWFHGSEEHDMHLAISTFRAIEHRVPLARAANTGVSAVIDGNGRVIASLPKVTPETADKVHAHLIVQVPLDDRTTLYTRLGDWVGQAGLLGVIAITGMSFRRRVGIAHHNG